MDFNVDSLHELLLLIISCLNIHSILVILTVRHKLSIHNLNKWFYMYDPFLKRTLPNVAILKTYEINTAEGEQKPH